MPFDPKDPLHSLDSHSGMLQDIDEVRQLALRVLQLTKVLMTSPLAPVIFSYGNFLDICFQLISMQAMLEFTSQADFNRALGQLMGRDPREVEQIIREFGLSENMAITDPNVPTPQAAALDPNDPVVQSSKVLRSVLQYQQRQKEQGTFTEENNIEHVKLSQGIEAFLQGLNLSNEEGGYEPEGD